MKLSAFRRIRPGKTWAVLGIALLVGLLAALAARSYLSNQMAAIEARAIGKTINVVVAKRELRKGERLSPENVAVRPIPVDYAHSAAVSPEAFDRLEGQALAYPVKAGEMILWGLMEVRRMPTFSARVESGRRAITVAVDEINSISGLLEPGDTVDLMITVDQKGRKITFPFLEGVQVMATGQRAADDPKSGERRQYSTVTLDTTPEQARHVIVAREAGKITALLRNPQDRLPGGQRSVDIAALLGSKGESTTTDADTRHVPVLYGGRGSQFPPEGLTLGRYVRTVSTPPREASAALPAIQLLDPSRVLAVPSSVPASPLAVPPTVPANPLAGPEVRRP